MSTSGRWTSPCRSGARCSGGFEDGGLLHHVGSDGVFDSGITSEGSYEHTFDAPGVYEYHCSVHRYMTGTVTVTG